MLETRIPRLTPAKLPDPSEAPDSNRYRFLDTCDIKGGSIEVIGNSRFYSNLSRELYVLVDPGNAANQFLHSVVFRDLVIDLPNLTVPSSFVNNHIIKVTDTISMTFDNVAINIGNTNTWNGHALKIERQGSSPNPELIEILDCDWPRGITFGDPITENLTIVGSVMGSLYSPTEACFDDIGAVQNLDIENSAIYHSRTMCDHDPNAGAPPTGNEMVVLSWGTAFFSDDVSSPAMLLPGKHPSFFKTDDPDWIDQPGKPVAISGDEKLACTSNGFTDSTMVFIPGVNSSPATTGIQGTPGLSFQEFIYLDLDAAGVTDPRDYTGNGWDNARYWFWDKTVWKAWKF